MIKAFIQKLLTKPKKVETSKDEVACTVVSGKEPYIGIPAPLVAPHDPWFAPPIKSEKTIMKEIEMKIQEVEEKKNRLAEEMAKRPDENIRKLPNPTSAEHIK